MCANKILKLTNKQTKLEFLNYKIISLIESKIKTSDKTIIEKIKEIKLKHYNFWQQKTNKIAKPNKLKLFLYKLLNFILGYTFTLKCLNKKFIIPQTLKNLYPEVNEFENDNKLINNLLEQLQEERLNYVGSMVLGLNDALVELTGAIAGLTLALTNTKVISISALITGISASLSMASSEFLSSKTESNSNALKSALYTGITYIITVIVLILPYLIIPCNRFISLGIMLFVVIVIIFAFNYYVAVAKSQPFKKRFIQMTIISLTVTIISFLIGLLVKTMFSIDV